MTTTRHLFAALAESAITGAAYVELLFLLHELAALEAEVAYLRAVWRRDLYRLN